MSVNSLSSKHHEIYTKLLYKRKTCYRICTTLVTVLITILGGIWGYQWFSIRSLENQLHSTIPIGSTQVQEKNIHDLEKKLGEINAHLNSLKKKKDWINLIQPFMTQISSAIPDDLRLMHVIARKKGFQLTGQTTELTSLKQFIDSLNESSRRVSFSLVSLQQTNQLYNKKPLLEFTVKSVTSK